MELVIKDIKNTTQKKYMDYGKNPGSPDNDFLFMYSVARWGQSHTLNGNPLGSDYVDFALYVYRFKVIIQYVIPTLCVLVLLSTSSWWCFVNVTLAMCVDRESGAWERGNCGNSFIIVGNVLKKMQVRKKRTCTELVYMILNRGEVVVKPQLLGDKLK